MSDTEMEKRDMEKPGTEAPDEAARAADTDDASRESGGDADVTDRIREALRGVSDPELGINIVDLGLVYDIEVADGSARVTMTLTSPGCPAGGEILSGAKSAAESIEGVSEAVVNLVWKPFWTPDRIDPKVRAMMGF